MKTSRKILALAVALAGLTATGSALAQFRHGPRVVVGIGIGVPYAAYPYYYPPYSPYYYPPYYPQPVVVQQQPTVYVEQPAPAASQPQLQGSWYYCTASRAYYPYVKDCASGWQQVAPQPQGG